jgi:predicted naringenin-chalcone synthase
MGLTILATGTATPDRRIAQTDAARMATGFANAEPGRERALAAIYRHSKIHSRGSVLLEDPGPDAFAQSFFPPAADADDPGPTTSARMARYAAEAGVLALVAARTALAGGGIAPAEVTHLVTCSCTGFANPGVDLELVHGLGLADSVARTNVGFMGCHGAFNSLRVADAFAAAPAAVVLTVCVELCSLHLQYGSRSDLVVANSLFADGAGAVLGVGAGHPRARRAAAWRIVGQSSRVLPDSGGQMGWLIGDHGFEMSLSPQVPQVIGRDLRGLVEETLARRSLALDAVGSWAVHPGGPRVLASVEESLGLDPTALAASRSVLGEHGNMSSATILFILERLIRADAPTPCLAMAFGPGLTAELALFDRG